MTNVRPASGVVNIEKAVLGIVDVSGVTSFIDLQGTNILLNTVIKQSIYSPDIELSLSISEGLGHLTSFNKIGLQGQEFIVDCIDYVMNGIKITDPDDRSIMSPHLYEGELTHTAVNQNSKDQLYQSAVDLEDFRGWLGNNFNILQDLILKMVDNEVLGKGNTKKVLRSSAIQNLLWMKI